MSEMIERVALAISGGDKPADILSIHRFRARAAFAAMHNPTKAMLEAARPEGFIGEFFGADAWIRMIDEALK